MVRDGLVEGEHVVTDHAEPDHPGTSRRAFVDRHDEAQRLDEVGSYAKQLLALGQGLAH